MAECAESCSLSEYQQLSWLHRLAPPNVNELESLVNAEMSSSAIWLNSQGFSNVQAYLYWSSSTYAGGTSSAWNVYMYEGGVNADLKAYAGYVWPVRAGQ